MPFQKGHAKFGGKKSGSHNKITRDVIAALDQLKCNPLEAVVRVAEKAEAAGELATAGTLYMGLLRKTHPDLKAIELSGPSGGPIEITNAGETLRSRIARLLERKRESGSS